MHVVGCDLGTRFLSAAYVDDGGTNIKSTPAVCTAVASDQADWLRSAGATVIESMNQFFLVGEEAIINARLSGLPLVRPLAKGVVTDDTNAPALRALLLEILPPATGDSLCYFSLPPTNVLDGTGYDVELSRAIISRVLSLLGFVNHARPQAYAALKTSYTSGVGLSFDSGMITVGLFYAGAALFTFSLSKAGWWVDKQASVSLNIPMEQATAHRLDPSFDVINPRTAEGKIIAIFMYSMAQRVFNFLIQEANKVLPRLNQTHAIPLVVSGADAEGLNFIDLVRQVYSERRAEVPFPIGSIELAPNPRLAVALGLL